ncbi:MAG: AAA family ATPase [Halobacteriales archaeon]|nr:AAA family ATPase [Halobacteriales archaeon]
MRDLVEEELRGPSVIRDAAKLAFDYVPDELPGREAEERQLVQLFKGLLSGATSQHVHLTGPVGAGKTALAKRFCKDFAEAAKKRDVSVQWVHINGRKRTSASAVLIGVLAELYGDFPDRGFSVDEMLKSLHKKLEPQGTRLLLILDEVDVLLKRSGSDLVYLLTRFNEEANLAQHGVSLILISQGDVRPYLDDASASTLKLTHHLPLKAYDQPGMQAIAHQRVELAFHPGTVPEEVEELVADIAAESGSARRVIELLEGAGLAADGERSRRVSAEHVRAAKADVESVVTEQQLRALDLHRKLALVGIARALRDTAYVVTGDAERAYHIACEERGEEPRGHTQFWTYLKDLEGSGLIDAKRSGKGHAGSTTIISLHDIPGRALEEKLLKLLR